MAEIVFDYFSDRAWRVCRCVFLFPFRNGYGPLVWQEEAGKPLVASMIANFGVLFLFASVMSLLVAFVFFDKEK